MENIPLLLSIATFIVILFLFFTAASFLAARKKEQDLLHRTEKWSEKAKNAGGSTSKERGSKGTGLFAFLGLSGKGNKGLDESMYADTPLFYQRAGIYNRSAIRLYQILRILLFLTPPILLIFSYLVYNRPVNSLTLLVVFMAAVVAYFLPVLWLKMVARARKKELDRTFPDAMDLLMVCVEAGLGIDSAIRRVSDEIHITSPELAKEFKILSLELKTGRSRNDCLKNLARRTDLPDVNNLVSLLIQADKYGTGVANALKVHSEEMRQKRYSRLEELAAKLPVKLVVPLILFIFPAFFVVIMGPAAIQVLRVIIQR
ncbi:MAG: type II secretion system F family protein [Desulfoarculaceae bacterium]|nr:type II secretion system F family protein [Desulfoarculaceae bacterium]